MKSFIQIVRSSAAVTVATLLLGAIAAPAQIPGGDKNSAAMNASMVRLFGVHTNFIAKAEARVLDKNQQEVTSMPMGFEMLGAKIRVDINMAEVKSKEMSPEFATTMKQMGMDQMTTILVPDEKQIISIYPGLKSYALSPMPNEDVEAAAREFKIEKNKIGKDTIDGHPCEKDTVTLTDDKGAKQKFTVWYATDLKDFPVQMQIPSDDAMLYMKFKDVKLGRPETSHFQAPASMTMYKSVNALIADAMTKKTNAGAPK